jgi:hypothetical protein
VIPLLTRPVILRPGRDRWSISPASSARSRSPIPAPAAASKISSAASREPAGTRPVYWHRARPQDSEIRPAAGAASTSRCPAAAPQVIPVWCTSQARGP